MDKNITPFISVIMPVYNCADYVAEAIQSILDQTFSDFELIIIDDNSSDNTKEIINAFADERIKLIEKPENTGYTQSLNIGINLSKGEFIARMDGDDISSLDRFEKQVSFLTLNTDVVVCGSWYEIISSNELIRNPVDHEDIKIALLDFCSIGHPTVMLRKSFIINNRLRYDEAMEPAEDYDLWTRIVPLGKLANIPEILLKYRDHSTQVSNTSQFKQKKNSLISKLRMLEYSIKNITESDKLFSNIIIKKEKIEDSKKLYDILNWLDHLIISNKQLNFYNEFKFAKYINSEKTYQVRIFYMHQSIYNPIVLYEFMQFKGSLKRYFTLNEIVRFTTKCILFWN